MTFDEYVKHGWKLCYIQSGFKRPTDTAWNRLDRAITNPEHAANLQNAGLQHAFSGTCAIDLDNVDLARFWFRDRGIDLDALMASGVRIHSGDVKRGKLIFALPAETPDLTEHAKKWPSKFIKNEDGSVNIIELRCGATTGNSSQDVLPPSTNPRTQQRYEWIGDWRNLPPLPEVIRQEWQKLVAPIERPTRDQLAPSAELDELRKLIANKDPSAPYDEWLRIGAIIHHETEGSDDGLSLWDEWSAGGASYKGIEDLEPHWNSFGNAPNPATAGSLRRESVAGLDELGAPEPSVIDPDDDILGSVSDAPLPLKLVKLGEFVKYEEVDYLVEGLIERGQLLGFIGQRKSGKSYAAFDLVYAVAQGRTWAKRKVMHSGRCVWVAAEGARSLERRRGPQWVKHYGEANIDVWPHPLNMRKPDVIRALTEACKGAALVVIDSLRRVTPGAKENSSDELAEVLAYAEELTRATGATVLFIAHAGKGDATTARGTSAIEDAFESAFGVEKVDDAKFKLTPVFARDEETGDDAALHFTLKEVKPEGCAPGMIVDWDVEQPTAKPKTGKPKAQLLVHQVLASLIPLDGSHIVKTDDFLNAYADKIPANLGDTGKRMKKANAELTKLAERREVEIDNARGLITVLQSDGHSAMRALLADAPEVDSAEVEL